MCLGAAKPILSLFTKTSCLPNHYPLTVYDLKSSPSLGDETSNLVASAFCTAPLRRVSMAMAAFHGFDNMRET